MAGALDVKTKELLGLVASAVLRCDDCVKYHLESSKEEGATKEEVMETLGIATLVGGTIVVPHLRRAYEYWEAIGRAGGLKKSQSPSSQKRICLDLANSYEATSGKYYEGLPRPKGC